MVMSIRTKVVAVMATFFSEQHHELGSMGMGMANHGAVMRCGSFWEKSRSVY